MPDSPTTTEILDLFEQTVSSIDELIGQLADDDWDLRTDLPGWTVKDNLSHLCHYEALAIGRPPPEDVDVSKYEHVKDEFGTVNERGVEVRRPLPGRAVAEEFREVLGERLKALRNLDGEAWETPISLPFGEVKQGEILGTRVMDFFYHEQDMRRGADKPGHLSGAVARFAFDRLATGMGFVLGKRVGAPEGTRVRFEIGPPGETFDVVIKDGRGQLQAPAGETDPTFAGDFETFLCLTGGRWSPKRALDDERWTASGDEDLIAKVHDGITLTP